MALRRHDARITCITYCRLWQDPLSPGMAVKFRGATFWHVWARRLLCGARPNAPRAKAVVQQERNLADR